MRRVRSLKIEYRISNFISAFARNFSVIIAQYCGRVVQESVHNVRTSILTFTHNPLRTVYSFLNTFLCTAYALFVHQVLHTFFMQFQSVSSMLYAQSTGPTITTTLNK